MSRDTGDASGPERDERDERGERDAELLTAYVDGVAELSPDERRRTCARLARDPHARADEAAVRTLLARLRALPPEGAEPDWAVMERSIGQAVGPGVPRLWWRNWRWLVPLATCATAAALLVMWSRPTPIRESAVVVDRGAHKPSPNENIENIENIVPLWLDGAEVDVDLSAATLATSAASDMLGGAEIAFDDPGPPDGLADDVGLLLSTNLAWVDTLDDAAIERAERWLSDVAVPTGPSSPSSLSGPSGSRKKKG